MREILNVKATPINASVQFLAVAAALVFQYSYEIDYRPPDTDRYLGNFLLRLLVLAVGSVSTIRRYLGTASSDWLFFGGDWFWFLSRQYQKMVPIVLSSPAWNRSRF